MLIIRQGENDLMKIGDVFMKIVKLNKTTVLLAFDGPQSVEIKRIKKIDDSYVYFEKKNKKNENI